VNKTWRESNIKKIFQTPALFAKNLACKWNGKQVFDERLFKTQKLKEGWEWELEVMAHHK
jgi:hypothetical protein